MKRFMYGAEASQCAAQHLQAAAALAVADVGCDRMIKQQQRSSSDGESRVKVLQSRRADIMQCYTSIVRLFPQNCNKNRSSVVHTYHPELHSGTSCVETK
jgi:hypothetical protein